MARKRFTPGAIILNLDYAPDAPLSASRLQRMITSHRMNILRGSGRSSGRRAVARRVKNQSGVTDPISFWPS